MTKENIRRGFTLIELLVVVLIIAILSSIAWPLYQKAILKSKMTKLSAIVQRFKDAEELYWLDNGRYTGSFADLDISFSGIFVNSRDPGFIYVGNNKDMIVDLFGFSPRWITTSNSATAFVEGSADLKTGKPVRIIIYLNHSAYPNQRFCRGDEAKCKLLGGQQTNISFVSEPLWKLP